MSVYTSKKYHVCTHVRMCVYANVTLYTVVVCSIMVGFGMHERCLSIGNQRYRGRAHVSGGVVMGSVCTQGRACFFRCEVMRRLYSI